MKFLIVLITALALSAGASASAQIIYNFAANAGDGTVTGAHGIDNIATSSSYWNEGASGNFGVSNLPLYDSTYSGTGPSDGNTANLTITTTGQTGSWANTSNLFDGNFSQQYYYAIYGGSATASISGIANGTYDLIVYTYGDGTSSDARNASVTLGATTLTTTFTKNGSWTQGDSYVEFSNVSVTNNSLAFNFAQLSTSGQGDADLNGFQLMSVPEPSLWVLTLGGLGLLLYFHHRTRRA